MINVKYIGLCFCSILLPGCLNAWVLPLKEQDISSFIPLDDEQGVPATIQFPTDCEWESFNRVVDGDTLVVGTNIRVRMLGIDTPESVIPNRDPEPLGVEAADHLRSLLNGQEELCLIGDPIGDNKDKYHRLLRYIYLPDGTDINGAMITSGFAKGYYRFPLSRKDAFKELESIPRTEKLGVWGLSKD